jgi:hypothetical protein
MEKTLFFVLVLSISIFSTSCGDTDTGDSGNTGNTGNTGDTGDTGDTGNTGDTGDDGNTADDSECTTLLDCPENFFCINGICVSDSGDTGNTGNTGDDDDDGDTGDDGDSGNTGNSGDEECPDGIVELYDCGAFMSCSLSDVEPIDYTRCDGNILYYCDYPINPCAGGYQEFETDCAASGGHCYSPYEDGCGGYCVYD